MTSDVLNISFVVVGDYRRLDLATRLAKDIGCSLALDVDHRWGPGINHIRAWVLGNTTTCDWVCVIEDDAILCDDFVKQAEQALMTAPSPLVSFYLGTSYPPHRVKIAESELSRSIDEDRDWVTLATLNHAVCVALRQDYVSDMIDYVAKRPGVPIDDAISEWALMKHVPVNYPVDSLVDHLDSEPVISANDRGDSTARTLPRRAMRFRGRRNDDIVDTT